MKFHEMDYLAKSEDQARIYGGGDLGGLNPPPPPPWAAPKKKKKKKREKKKEKKKKRKKKERTLERNPFKCIYCEKIFNSSGDNSGYNCVLNCYLI